MSESSSGESEARELSRARKIDQNLSTVRPSPALSIDRGDATRDATARFVKLNSSGLQDTFYAIATASFRPPEFHPFARRESRGREPRPQRPIRARPRRALRRSIAPSHPPTPVVEPVRSVRSAHAAHRGGPGPRRAPREEALRSTLKIYLRRPVVFVCCPRTRIPQ